MKRRVLITGASGMLGATLATRWAGAYDVYATGGSDFANNPAPRDRYRAFDLAQSSYDELLRWAAPEVIVHCAAWTSVDGCEDDPDRAYAVNAESVRKLAAADARMIFISTDAVFGETGHPATEQTQTAPLNEYGRSKLAGESYMRSLGARGCVVRTTVVGRNVNRAKQSFAEWIVASVSAGRSITLFSDAMFTPIAATALADELEWIIAHPTPPVVHVAGAEAVSKLELGRRLCAALALGTEPIHPGTIVGFPFRAPRSADQTLDSSLYRALSGRPLPTVDATIRALSDSFGEKG